jgi:RHS repeat-associated protein
LITVTYPDNSTVQFTRDANGNVTRMVDSLGTSNYVYDELNRLTSYTDPFGKAIGYQYDEIGNVTKLTYPDGKQVTYAFDANNRMSSFTDWAGKTTTFGYDSTNLLTSVTYPNGIVSSFTYDKAGRLIGKSDSGISSYTFTLDKNGNRTGATISQPLGSRPQNISQASAYDAANRIQNAGTATFGFDNNGNMISKTEGGATTNYGYDFENRLVSVSGSSTYLYNGQGVRLQKTEGGITTRFVVDSNHDLSELLCETDANGTITSYYVYGLGLAYKVTTTGTHYYYSFDPLGSTIAMTDDAKNVVNSYAYDPFGKVTNAFEGTQNPFQFAGRFGVMLEQNGLYFMRARFYLPQLGRFTSMDPGAVEARFPHTLNRFRYAANNPLLFIDPKGLLEYGSFWYNITNFVDSPFSQAVIQSVKTVPDFVECNAIPGLFGPDPCHRIGYTDWMIAVERDAYELIDKSLTGGVISGVVDVKDALELYAEFRRTPASDRGANLDLLKRAFIGLFGEAADIPTNLLEEKLDELLQIGDNIYDYYLQHTAGTNHPVPIAPRGPQNAKSNPVGKPAKKN